MKTPAPQRAAGRKKLAAQGDALPDGSEPIPNVTYLKKAIRSVGRLDPSKRPALKTLIRKRARELGALNAPGVKGTWAFANDPAGVIDLVGPKGYEHGWKFVGVAGEKPYVGKHISDAERAVREGRSADAVNHLTAAHGGTENPELRGQIKSARDDLAAKVMGKKPAVAKAEPKVSAAGESAKVGVHLTAAAKAAGEGRHADAINHLTAAHNAAQGSGLKSMIAQRRSELAARVMGRPAPKSKKAPRTPEQILRDPRAPTAARIRARKAIMSDMSKTFENRSAIIRRAESARDGSRVLANDDGQAIEMATMTGKMPKVCGAADVTCTRSGPGSVTVMHTSTGSKVGTLDKGMGGWQATHRTGKKLDPAPTMAASMNGLIGYHNKLAAGQPASTDMAADGATVSLATPAATSSDGPRVTAMAGGKKATAAAGAASMSAEAKGVYAKLIKKGFSPKQAAAFAKRAAAMHAKDAAKQAA